MTCEDVHQRLVDYLYGGLLSLEKADFDQHLTECSTCCASVKAFEETLRMTRASLAGPLDEALPAPVHKRILSVVERTKVRSQSPNRLTPKFFTRIIRTPWFLPMYGATAIGAFLFLVGSYQKHNLLPGQEPTRLDETGVIPPANKVSPAARPTHEEQPLGHLQANTSEKSTKISPIVGATKRSLAEAPLDDAEKPALYLAFPPPSRTTSPRKTLQPVHENSMHIKEDSIAKKLPMPSTSLAVRKSKSPEPVSLNELLRKADNHFQAKKWSAARDSYQDLIRRFPNHSDVDTWRERLKQAMAFEASEQPIHPTSR